MHASYELRLFLRRDGQGKSLRIIISFVRGLPTTFLLFLTDNTSSDKVAVPCLNVPIKDTSDFIYNHLLKEIVRRIPHWEEITAIPPYLAADIGKEGVIHLPSSVDEDIRTVKDLLDGGFFKKVHQGALIVYLIFEQQIEEESYDAPNIYTPFKKIKKEKKVKEESRTPSPVKREIKQPRIKQERKLVKREKDDISYERKRAISQLSDTQEARSLEGSSQDILEGTTSVYSLRSRRGI
jgi:hypothetical protein